MFRAHFVLGLWGLFRLIYLAVDAHGFSNIFPKELERILFGLGFFLIVTCYTFQAIAWIDLYILFLKQRKKKNDVPKLLIYYDKITYGCLALTFALLVVLEIIRTNFIAEIIYQLYFFCVTLGLTLSILITGYKIYKQMQKMQQETESDTSRAKWQSKVKNLLLATLQIGLLLIFVLLLLVVNLSLEAAVFNFEDPYYWFAWQWVFRVTEVAIVLSILYKLKDAVKYLRIAVSTRSSKSGRSSKSQRTAVQTNHGSRSSATMSGGGAMSGEGDGDANQGQGDDAA